jgi:hypothetical protein
MCSQVLQDNFTGAPEYSGSCGTEPKNISKSVLVSTICSQIKQFGCANFGVIGCIGHVAKSILMHLKPGDIIPGSDYFNVGIK